MKKVLITGASRGIGRATAEKFLEAGWQVFGLARNFEKKISHPNFQEIIFDLANISELKSLLKKVTEIDVLVNNAGIMNAERDSEISVNMIAPIELALSFGAEMQKGGRIISVASIAAQIGHPDIWYGATKGALVNATKSLAKKFAGKIICNAVAPGPVETDMLDEIPEERKIDLKNKSATKRFASPQEVAETIYWLSTTAPTQINGEIININGGI